MVRDIKNAMQIKKSKQNLFMMLRNIWAYLKQIKRCIIYTHVFFNYKSKGLSIIKKNNILLINNIIYTELFEGVFYV